MIRILTIGMLAALALGGCRREPGVAHARCDPGALMRDLTWFFPASMAEGHGFEAGETVLVGGAEAGEFCVYSTSRPELKSAWVPLDAVQPIVVDAALPEPWAGAWTGPAGRIDLSEAGGRLHVRAALPSAPQPALEVETTPTGDMLAFTAEGCGVSARKLAGYLIVVDNALCAGGGASFSGIYRKRG